MSTSAQRNLFTERDRRRRRVYVLCNSFISAFFFPDTATIWFLIRRRIRSKSQLQLPLLAVKLPRIRRDTLFAIPLIHICLSSAHNCNFKIVEFSEKSPPPSRPPSRPLFPASRMEKSNIFRGGYLNGANHPSFSSSSSRADVNYSCGSCGYELNLSSSNRNTSTIGSNKYGKSIKRGIISFFNIDESRFTQVDELKCKPHFSKRSWGLFSRRTKLLCRKCGNHIGNAYDEYTSSSYPLVLDESDSSARHEVTKCRKFDVRIRALQPSYSEEFGTSILE